MKSPCTLPTNKKKVVIYSSDLQIHACPIIRIITPMQFRGWDVVWAVNNDDSGTFIDIDVARTADLIIIQRHFPSENTAQALRSIVRLKIPIAYDLDDALLDIPQSHPLYNFISARAPYVRWILKEADLISVSTVALQQSLKRHTKRRIVVLPNLLDWNLFDAPPRVRSHRFNFLISGTPTHEKDWAIIEEPLARILDRYKNEVNAIFFGEPPKRFADHPSVQVINFQAGYRKYASELRNLDIHAALIPLEDTEFNRCKSNIKWLEYSTSGIVGIYSNVVPYTSSITHGETGLLVDNTPNAWYQAMEHLLTDPAAGSVMIQNARRQVRVQYAINTLSNTHTDIFDALVGQKHVRNHFSTLPTLPTRLGANAHQFITSAHRFLNRHFLWRFNRKH